MRHFTEVFGTAPGDTSTADQLLNLRQGKDSISDYSLRFLTLVATSGWNETAPLGTYRMGLNQALRLAMAMYADTLGLKAFIQRSIPVSQHLAACRTPEEMVSDQGSQFTSHVWRAFFQLLGVTDNLSSGYHPQSNGQTERKIQELGSEARPPPPEVLDPPSVYSVREVLDSRRQGRGLEYLVDWEGYGPEEQSWVARQNILDPALLEEFHATHPLRPAPQGRGRPRHRFRASGAAPGGGGTVRDPPATPLPNPHVTPSSSPTY
ncbi:hypothetical protein HF521_002885 [Silurus meridionalis]|uniref:Uncharacterized protein n=1 Tax=Silurus meridionalis TaxID=175797 RepID=A0A8T0B191_SILME|nr:hypothetical protein HF521_002885 [Silurus meridionalis]